ncbi:MAG: 2-oxo acid dehydrogenase subunit E2 ['Waltheria sp.' little leaf phytoplasma]|nr:2-oxo acid dehydrogenase subunit E2 ['Waltheria sp.' little leaf phytoplasma]
MNDGTFTLSNWGTFGVSYGTPVIYFPQVAILGMGVMKLSI